MLVGYHLHGVELRFSHFPAHHLTIVAESASEDGDWAAITHRSETATYGRCEERGTMHAYFALMPIAMSNVSLPSYYAAMAVKYEGHTQFVKIGQALQKWLVDHCNRA